MEGMLGRSQFLGETSTLFTDEKTANARAKVVEWLNKVVIADPQTKCELVAKVQETILSSCCELLDEFIEHILSMAHDANMDVRKQIVGFIEQICRLKVEMLPQIVNIVSMLLRDRSPQVIKRIIQACGSIYKNGLKWICQHKEMTDTIEQTWNVLSLIKAQILDMIDNDNDGIRTNAIKFLEGVVVLQTYPDEDSQKKENDFSLENIPEELRFIKRKKLEEEAANIFDIMLKFHAATHISSVNLIACTGSLCQIAKLRTSLMGPVVDAFRNLNANLPPTLTDSQVSSVRKSLKMQLIALLKNRGSYEYQATIRRLLLELGASQGEIQRSIPKMDKQEQMRRQKRILENAATSLQKRMRVCNQHQPMELDEEELKKQQIKSNKVNEKFIAEHLRSTEIAVNFIMEFLPKLPDTVPPEFLNQYTPIKDMSVHQQVCKIAKDLGEQMTEQKIGPGAAAFTKDPPLRPATSTTKENKDDDVMDIDENNTNDEVLRAPDDDQMRKDEATKKLRENMERLKGEQELIERMKQRVKALKLQEVTKPLTRSAKEKFLLDAVKRILHSERQCIVGGVSAKRRKILTVMAATFPDNVRYFIFNFVMQDIKQRIDIAFSWLYEEYCLLQGFTRHSYVKSENRPDYAYNELLGQIVAGICKNCDFKDKIILLRRVFLEAPIIPDDAITTLITMCKEEEEDFTNHCMNLIKDLAILRPPRKQRFVRILLTFSVHERLEIRERALQHIVTLYNDMRILVNRIEDFAIEWLLHLEKELPPVSIFSTDYGRPSPELGWREETAKICLVLALTLLPYNPDLYLQKLCKVYIVTSADLKRTILRSIDASIRKLGDENKILLKFIEDCPKGAETLIIRMIYILTERIATPNVDLVERVRELYVTKIKDVRVLIPVLSGLTREEILNALPKLLKLNNIVVREVFNRLLGIGPEFANQRRVTSPADILVTLHTIDVSECELKCIVKATSMCLAEKDIYTQEVLIAVLQQLVEKVPIPTLLMRTVIQSLTLYPHISSFVLNLLQRLILKQVWRYKVIWEGFLKCCQRMKTQALPILLQLPAQQLMDALMQCPDLRQPLLEYAKSIQDEPMSGINLQLMDILSGKSVEVFVTDESGGYINVQDIKKEKDEEVPPDASSEISLHTVDPGQPLPPGED